MIVIDMILGFSNSVPHQRTVRYVTWNTFPFVIKEIKSRMASREFKTQKALGIS